MPFKTPICDLLEIDVPIFLAGMGGVAYADICAAVSEAGGYGTLGMAAEPSRSPNHRDSTMTCTGHDSFQEKNSRAYSTDSAPAS